jgi:hypothetical protein
MTGIAYTGGAGGLVNPYYKGDTVLYQSPSYAPPPVYVAPAPAPTYQPPIASAPAPTVAGAPRSPCSSCVFNGGTTNNAVIPTSGAAGSGYIQPPTPLLKAVAVAPAPARTPQDLAVFLQEWGPELAVGLLLLLVLAAAASRRAS